MGDRVSKGDLLAKCGNSGNSPYPHLHFHLQATPHIGSRTIEYPIANYLLKGKDGPAIFTTSMPAKNDIIASIQVHPALRRAFHFIPGQRLKLRVQEQTPYEVEWEVKIDFYLNKYIECQASKSRAYFKVDDAMLYFTHFEGDRSSPLYFFYLATFRVCFGYYPNLQLHDSYPVNLIFRPIQLFLHDFTAPFFMYMKGRYHLIYSGELDPLADTKIALKANTTALDLGREKERIATSLYIDNSGLKGFEVEASGRKFEVEVMV